MVPLFICRFSHPKGFVLLRIFYLLTKKYFCTTFIAILILLFNLIKNCLMETIFMCSLAAIAAIVGFMSVAFGDIDNERTMPFIISNSYMLEFKKKWQQRLCRILALIYIVGWIVATALFCRPLNVVTFIVSIVLGIAAFVAIHILCFVLVGIMKVFIILCENIKDWVWND